MPAGIINLDVRYLDVESGLGIAVEKITGVIRNAVGTLIEEVAPEAFSDLEGVFYRLEDYDTRDASKFFGTFITVEWKAQRYGVWLPVFEKKYFIDPVAEAPANRSMVYWDPFGNPNLFFYNVYRFRTDPSEEVFAGRSFSNSFVDVEPFVNEFEARSWQYKIRPVLKTPGVIQPDGSDYVEKESSYLAFAVYRTSNGVCQLDGAIATLSGAPVNFNTDTIGKSSVVFRVNWRDRFQILRDAVISTEDVYVLPSYNGRFSVSLLWDAVVEMWIPPLNFRVRFLVPRKDQADFSSIEFEYVREK